jgi:hypothetical protein
MKEALVMTGQVRACPVGDGGSRFWRAPLRDGGPCREQHGSFWIKGYLSSRERRRSARGLPPVWQVGQYWRAESANETSRTVSPQTGQA